jgi:ADP-ribosylglycohydrolase
MDETELSGGEPDETGSDGAGPDGTGPDETGPDGAEAGDPGPPPGEAPLGLTHSRAAGAILGAALGDALGLQVEGDETDTVADRHPRGPDYPYKGAFRGFPPCDWTDATDFSVLVMRTLAAYVSGKTERPELDFAKRVVSWEKSGFPELGDAFGVGTESVVVRCLAQHIFASEPFEAARQVKGPKADNGALLRMPPCAFTAAPADWATLFCEVTHADERCLASSLTFAALLNALAHVPAGARIPPAVAAAPVAAGRAAIRDLARQSDFMKRLTETRRLTELRLGERDNRAYTVKTLACAMWALRQLIKTPPARRDATFFKETVRAVAAQGGDAGANAAVAGAVLGAALGIEKLPADWIDALPHGKWLAAEIAAFLTAVAPTWPA